MAVIQIDHVTAMVVRAGGEALVTTFLGDRRLPLSYREWQHAPNAAGYVDLGRRSPLEGRADEAEASLQRQD